MTNNVKKVLRAFTTNPYRVRMGAKTQAKRLNVSVEDIPNESLDMEKMERKYLFGPDITGVVYAKLVS